MNRMLFSIIAVTVILSAAFAESQIWLDLPLSNWNQSSEKVPQAPASSGDYGIRCKAQVRPPENLLDQALVGAGWMPFGVPQSDGGTFIITAMSGANASCRPLGYQAFVFSDGKVAGTLSPALMNSQMDGSIQNIRMFSGTAIEVDFSRVPASNISSVRFEIRQSPTGPVLVPLEIRHAKQVIPESVVSTPASVVSTPAPMVSTPAPEVPKSPEPPNPTPKDPPVVVQEAHSELLGFISNPSLLKGCGCFLKTAAAARPDDPYIFLTNVQIEKRAWVNIGGENISLPMLRSTMPDEKKFKVKKGYEFQEEYGAGDIRILVDYVVKTLPAENQSFADYDATLTITAGERKETIAASGKCGCIRTP